MEADQVVEHAVLDQTNVDELRLLESIVLMTHCTSGLNYIVTGFKLHCNNVI